MNGKMIVGILALVGIIVGVVCFFSKNKSKNKGGTNQSVQDSVVERGLSFNSGDRSNVDMAKEKLAEEKANLAEDIKTRHEEAANEMKESLNHIFDEEPVAETENTETLNEMMDDLDKLMD